ncbi:DEAD/DEAH box helicase [Candidatus Woesearchaeota archaeon]|nr:DEAD/DEAH box helicase [Candidatus Woesearchaeota archaeon]
MKIENFKGFKLDDFQKEAIASVEKHHSVVVSAATGTGKTLIADYIIDKFIKQKKQIIYTAPIKALSNQKFRDFKKDYGNDAVGLLTGDIVINPTAPVLIMTTEIYRNMLLSNDKTVDNVTYVIFDEIHFMSDIERGTVWEESLIFSPEHIRFLCLSATIPNAKEFAEWIKTIKGHNVDVIEYSTRAVPLKHYLYDSILGLTNAKKLADSVSLDDYPDYDYVVGHQKKRKKHIGPPPHTSIVKELKTSDWLPAIYFVFSRRACEEKSRELAKNGFDFSTPQEKNEIISYYNKKVVGQAKQMQSSQRLRNVISKGIAYHHAGLLPVLKEVVENLFAKGLIKVLYTTETFAVGINMPAKTVCFNTLEKYDGISFRYLNSKEYFQLAGRAGRRGIDKIGRAIATYDREHDDLKKIIHFTSRDIEPITSQFKLSVNTAINLVAKHNQEEVETILKSNFDYYQRRAQGSIIRIMATYNRMLKRLKAMNYLTNNNELTEKGQFITRIYTQELLVGEIFSTKMWQELDEPQINLLCASIIYEGRMGDRFKTSRNKRVDKLFKVLQQHRYVYKKINKKNLNRLAKTVMGWSENIEFKELINLSNLQEGDYIRLFRQVIDLLRQIRRATNDHELTITMTNCIHRLQRDVVAFDF